MGKKNVDLLGKEVFAGNYVDNNSAEYSTASSNSIAGEIAIFIAIKGVV